MPKMKTHSGASKRFKLTGSGKIKRHRMNKRHILTKKDAKRKAKLRKATYICDADYQRILPLVRK